MSELYSADDDHPLKTADFSFSNLSISESNNDQINAELSSVAVDWKPFRNTTTCSCSTPFDQIVGKVSVAYFIFIFKVFIYINGGFCRIIVDDAVMCFVHDVSIEILHCQVMPVVIQFQFVEHAIEQFNNKIVLNFFTTYFFLLN